MNSKPMLRYQAALLASALALLAISVPRGLGNPFAVLGLAVVAALAERGRVQLSSVTQVSISVLPTVFAAAVFGPLAALIVAAASFLSDFPLDVVGNRALTGARGDRILRWGVYTCIRAIYGGAAGFAALGLSVVTSQGTTTRLIAATVAATFVAEPLDLAFAAFTLRLRGGSAMGFLRMCAPMYAVSACLYTPIVAALTVAYAEVSPWTMPLFFLPALAAQRLFGLYQGQRQLAARLVDANADLEKANISFATALVTTLDARDRYTAGHSAAVAIYARDIAARMGLSEQEAATSHLAGLVHDIGKIGLSAGLLEKPGALTLEERREMQRHSEIGERILAKVESYTEIASIVRHHHERVDGGGYPDGILYHDIPLLSRIIAVADAYNAMTSDRPYRDAMPSRVARLRLAQAVETQFDTSVVAAFEAVLAGASEPYRMARSPEFSFEWQHEEAEAYQSDESSVAAFSISA
ncbi:MAG TPA: HD-GYP domain-containing protein [Gaiellaceae bacterium]|nr:HD-GYP domain-containing protein [Gaiellaceae bacterium]